MLKYCNILRSKAFPKYFLYDKLIYEYTQPLIYVPYSSLIKYFNRVSTR